jgi:NADH dehydrogenase (ubiquinone) Fe-S protein 5
MSSGFGFNSGKGRCFGEFQRYIECYTNASTEHPTQCTPHAEDYFECLHHKKEKTRVAAIRKQYLKNLSNEGKPAKSVLNTAAVRKDTIPQVLGLIDE